MVRGLLEGAMVMTRRLNSHSLRSANVADLEKLTTICWA